jgi:N utilization substance protein A
LSLLDGEKIDFIEQTDDPLQLIRNCLKPAHIDNIEIQDHKAIVTIEESQKALAIGKGASNVKLASQLTGFQIEII